ncbi:MAG: type IV pilus secretin PilQ [Burkholderiaceae bacterium]|nr:type IV pilus secretin PilQ [Burkholderiaceae bacterium]
MTNTGDKRLGLQSRLQLNLNLNLNLNLHLGLRMQALKRRSSPVSICWLVLPLGLLLSACQSSIPAAESDEVLIDTAAQRALAQRSTQLLSAQALGAEAVYVAPAPAQGAVSNLQPDSSVPSPPRVGPIDARPTLQNRPSVGAAQAPAGSQAAPQGDARVSLDVSQAPIQEVLQAIAQVAGVNVVMAQGVKGLVSVQLKDVQWRAAMQALLRANELGMSQTGTVLWIAPKHQVLAEQQQRLLEQQAATALEPLQTRAFAMNYAKAVDVAAYLTGAKTSASVANKGSVRLLPGADGTEAASTHVASAMALNKAPNAFADAGPGGHGLTGVLSSRGSVMPEPRTNQLFVSDVAHSLAKVAELIAHIDVPVRQVLIEARIVEADDTFSQELGARLGGGIVPAVGVGSAGGSRIAGVIGPNYEAIAGQVGGGVAPFVNLPSSGLNGRAASTFAVSLFTPDATRFINLELSALEADGRGVIVSRPSIVTADQVQALIEQGTEFPYQTLSSSGVASVAFRRATLRLAVVPHITPHGQVMLRVDINKDSRGETTAQGVAINTKHVQTQVLVDNAGTAVIGGIFERYDRDVDSQVPLLGDIPGLGVLFRNRSTRSDKSEMLIFLTPHILAAPGAQTTRGAAPH